MIEPKKEAVSGGVYWLYIAYILWSTYADLLDAKQHALKDIRFNNDDPLLVS